MDISILILTYKSRYDKLIETINSIIKQRMIKFEIIVSEDSNKNEFYDDLKNYFQKIGFTEFILVENENNVGTVKNLQRALKYASGKYVKPISPGDLLIGTLTLYDYMQKAIQDGVVAVFGNPKCYYNNNLEKYSNLRMPIVIKPYIKWNSRKALFNILIRDDWICGATLFYDNKILKRYINIISDYIVYCEDAVIPLMIMDGYKISCIDKYMILYEYGSGISKSKNIFNKNRMNYDQEKLCELIEKYYIKFSYFSKRRKRWIKLPFMNKYHKILCEIFIVPEYIISRILHEILPARNIFDNEDNK